MKINVALYHLNLPHAKMLLERNLDKTPSKVASIVTQGTMCPLIASVYLVAAHTGLTDDLIAMAARLCDFYGYTDITGIDELNNLVKVSD